MKIKSPAVYIMANKTNGTLYTGVTSDLLRRVFEHRASIGSDFCTQYNCKMLVWYYLLGTMTDAIHMEKILKKGSRARKIRLIEAMNPLWKDLYPDIYHQ